MGDTLLKSSDSKNITWFNSIVLLLYTVVNTNEVASSIDKFCFQYGLSIYVQNIFPLSTLNLKKIKVGKVIYSALLCKYR